MSKNSQYTIKDRLEQKKKYIVSLSLEIITSTTDD